MAAKKEPAVILKVRVAVHRNQGRFVIPQSMRKDLGDPLEFEVTELEQNGRKWIQLDPAQPTGADLRSKEAREALPPRERD